MMLLVVASASVNTHVKVETVNFDEELQNAGKNIVETSASNETNDILNPANDLEAAEEGLGYKLKLYLLAAKEYEYYYYEAYKFKAVEKLARAAAYAAEGAKKLERAAAYAAEGAKKL